MFLEDQISRQALLSENTNRQNIPCEGGYYVIFSETWYVHYNLIGVSMF
jgi:hypothetical protein